MKTINIFILAAGFGERLRPITNHIPKPLLPILGKPAIEMVVDRVASLTIGRIGINAHYKKELLTEWVKASPNADKIDILLENQVLGTGGALKNAEPLLKSSVFLTYNSDIVSSINLQELVDKHISSGKLVTLAVHDYPKFNTVWIDTKGLLRHVGQSPWENPAGLRPVAFTGIAVYSPDFLRFLPEGRSSVVDAWLRALSAGFTVGTADFTGCFWRDIGTPEAYASVIFETLKKEGETVYVHPSVDCEYAEVSSCGVFEQGSSLEGPSYLHNCILLPGSKVAGGSHIENSLVGPDYIISFTEPFPATADISSPLPARFSEDGDEITRGVLIGTGGSDKKYYRVLTGEKTSVLMECVKTDPDYQRHMTYTRFFRKYALPVPELLYEDAEKMQALFEDLGDTSLHSWLKCRKDPENIEKIYKRVLDILSLLHTVITDNIPECPPLQSRVFDYEHLRWETGYFLERFVKGLRDFDRPQELLALELEFHSLARTVDSFKKAVVHRDFQSQNIMISKGDVPALIDFQGARMGPPAYDIASLLWDPYFIIGDDIRDRLLNYYTGKMKDYFGEGFDLEEFQRSLLPCRLQRHMQALGAYAFLSRVKGKTHFLKYVPQALCYLDEEAELAQTEYPGLHALVRKMREK